MWNHGADQLQRTRSKKQEDKAVVAAIPHLRERIKGFESDQQRTFEHFDQLEQAHRELFESQRSARICREEIAALRQALSHTTVKYAFDEREQLLKLQANHDQLRIRCAENRYFIQNLLDLTESAASRKDEGIFRDRRPGRAQQRGGGRGGDRGDRGGSGGGRSGKGAPTTQMVYLHADREQILADAVDSLQRFLGGKVELQQLRLAQLRADKQHRALTGQTNVVEHGKRIERHSEWLNRVERRLTAVTRDYLRLRRESLAEAGTGKEERERLKAFTSSVQLELKKEEKRMEKMALMTHLGGESGGSMAMRAAARGAALGVAADIETFEQAFEMRVGEREADLHTLRERCEENQQSFTTRIEKLTGGITSVRQQTRRMHRLRDTEFAYFTESVAELRGLVRRSQSQAVARSMRRPRSSSRRRSGRAAAAAAARDSAELAPAALQARVVALQQALAQLR